MEPEGCKDCRYWHAVEWDGADEASPTAGACRRRPPTITGQPASDTEVRFHTYFPETSAEDWCGEYEPSSDRSSRDVAVYRIDREANALVTAARTAAAGEAREPDPTDWRVDWRPALGRVSQRISREVPDLDGDIRDRAKVLAGDDEAVLELLNWAGLDTALAEITAQ